MRKDVEDTLKIMAIKKKKDPRKRSIVKLEKDETQTNKESSVEIEGIEVGTLVLGSVKSQNCNNN